MDFRILDNNSPHFGVPLSRLMENAARALADVVKARYPKARHVLIASGPGNNGGDGIAVAPLIASWAKVTLVLSEPSDAIRTKEARAAYARLDRSEIPVDTFQSMARFRAQIQAADLLVDALLGSGSRGELRGPVRAMARLLNASRKPVLSVDVPTGLGTRGAVRPQVTVALHARKEGLTRKAAGTVLVRPIGIPREAETHVGPADFFVAYPRNAPDSHKGQNGRLLIVAGGPYGGAPILAARAAARTGIDLVRLYTPAEVAPVAQSAQHDLVVHPGLEARRVVAEDALRLRALYARVDAVLLGPGLGDDTETREAVARILADLAKARTPTVLDADAIRIGGRHPRTVRRLRPVVTPHHAEFREFTGQRMPKPLEGGRRRAEAQAQRLRSVLLVKGGTDIITDGRRTKFNQVHHQAMTVGGTGDVLAGLVAGFLAKKMDPFRAACAAAFVAGEAGQRVADRQGGTLVASDLIREIPRVFRRWL